MNVNKVILVGRAGKDPEARETGKGEAVANISLATNSGYGDNEKTDWHRVTFFGNLANTVIDYVKKGQEIYVEGRISYSKYTGKDGVEKYSTSIIAYSMQMGKKESGSGSAVSSANGDDDSLPF
jgi:single-strand DNA-binding protein|tara:strand:+ start:11 stop:382 length:372 start_codon:yes stop_codon:yes gene_type:complete